jgi:hypothetical protein
MLCKAQQSKEVNVKGDFLGNRGGEALATEFSDPVLGRFGI